MNLTYGFTLRISELYQRHHSSENRMEGCACNSAPKRCILAAEQPASLTSFLAAGLVEVNNIEQRLLALEVIEYDTPCISQLQVTLSMGDIHGRSMGSRHCV
jgi:hypothetical protein